jgi:hypothetical protein
MEVIPRGSVLFKIVQSSEVRLRRRRHPIEVLDWIIFHVGLGHRRRLHHRH